MRVLIAMSGGVDSAVAAARLVDAGHEVIGVTLHLWDYPDAKSASHKSRCCAPEDAHDARLVADFLGFPHYTFDRRELFSRAVVEPFVSAYFGGRTPSPCVWCNRSVKMRELLTLAQQLGAEAVATGHYARIVRDSAGIARLFRGKDHRKDQSYFLYMLRADELARLQLPLGASVKGEVRQEAIDRALPGATKGESQELCFVPTGHYVDFVQERAGERVRSGPIVATDGRVLGQHQGIHRYTVGQRRGLGIAVGAAAFVTAIDAASDTIVVGSVEEAHSSAATLHDAVWCDDVTFPLRAQVKVRSHHEAAAAQLDYESLPDSLERHIVARFDEPVRAVSPGQVAVAYDGERVLGGATIAKAHE